MTKDTGTRPRKARDLARAVRKLQRSRRKEAPENARAVVAREAKPRRRDAEATRQAILDAAVQRFGEAAYDQVGLREIAGLAGIDVALIGRYFGSKEALFEAAITPPPHPKVEFPADRRGFGEWMARRILNPRPEVARMLIVHHAAANPQAALIVGRHIRERLIEPLAGWIGGGDAVLRAGLIVAHLTGVRLLRDIAKLRELTEPEREAIVRLLAPALQHYVDG